MDFLVTIVLLGILLFITIVFVNRNIENIKDGVDLANRKIIYNEY